MASNQIALEHTNHRRKLTWTQIQPWLSFAVRLGMVGVLIFAAIPKLQDLNASVRAVRAYRLLPEAIVPFVGTTLPILELALAVVLLLGIFTKQGALVWNLMMLGFTAGVVWVWIKGYSIDCGCFGGGGDVDPAETNYPGHLLERIGFLGAGAFLYLFPRTPLSVDAWIGAEDSQAEAGAVWLGTELSDLDLATESTEE